MGKGELLRFVTNNLDLITGVSIDCPNKLGVGNIKIHYSVKRLDETREIKEFFMKKE
jgi:hypothetical protein